MHVQQASAQQQSHNLHRPALPDFESSFAAYTGRAAAVYSCEFPLIAARLSAMRAADEHGLPMTVYRTADSHGWGIHQSDIAGATQGRGVRDDPASSFLLLKHCSKLNFI